MKELWVSALRRLSSQIAPQNYDMWLRPIECDSINGNTLHLKVPNPYVRLWFESNYLDSVLSELHAETGTTYQVEIEVLDEDAPNPVNTPPVPETLRVGGRLVPTSASPEGEQALGSFAQEAMAQPPVRGPRISDTQSSPQANGTPSPAIPHAGLANPSTENGVPDPLRDDSIINVALNPRYNFNSFVAGPSNQLALAAAQSCANSYPPKYNPVFICGGVGLGKTHLLHAIGHQIIKTRPNSRLCYISGERFMNEYVHAIRTNQMHTFRHRYRESCDVLLVDDVQFLAGKDGTQDEFFHTFNALHDSHRQIVLTADRKPHEISDIADRLRSRFAWGLLADIEPPELEVRMAILSEKAAAENIHLPDSVSMYIASSIKSNVRELEGALIRLAAYASLSRKEITLEFARETLEGSITRPPEHLTVDTIIKTVAGYYGLKVADLKSPRRHKSIAGPRAVAMYLARTHTKESYPDLGRAFGGKHHTTVISAVEKIIKKLLDDDGLRGEIVAIDNNLLR
ncbi:MAG: chromosomal replication initiator protein DnaA [Myxococcales bacterium]|nr:chromosomal replication initiator protein DnaA [Myxococcales bacterium]